MIPNTVDYLLFLEVKFVFHHGTVHCRDIRTREINFWRVARKGKITKIFFRGNINGS